MINVFRGLEIVLFNFVKLNYYFFLLTMTFGIYTFKILNYIINYSRSKMKKILENKKIVFGILGTLIVIAIVVGIILILGNKKYTITFNTDGGNDIASITIKEKESITLPIAEKEGFIFNGWTDEDGKILPSEYVVTKDATLKAVWVSETADTITIKFDTNGGSKIDDIIVVKGKTLKLPKNPIKKGSTFCPSL